MPETENGAVRQPSVAAETVLAARSAAVLVELQRADGKAAALCALSGGTLAAVLTAGPVWSAGSAWEVAVVLAGCVLLLAAMAAALLALRPALPRNRSLAELEAFRSSARRSANTLADLLALDRSALAVLEARRLRRLAGLADRKFRAVRTSVDLIVAACTVTGIGLLISYVN
ncbi:Pycsar system effector family protein [Kitasatospora phosalacinea]|uniref:Pycsar effector protein domain-containing protein n=1 Tax=Kitasatospora phosalacinea TaxID=2065 RepID=A0A9W6PR47_9ACTN|nr:Pycsar system effector family protein [Kitasatospora phosalacinea]GLW59373.1 hypothetical protein Kpho01_73830 [Kitasatospora phosalacinea]